MPNYESLPKSISSSNLLVDEITPLSSISEVKHDKFGSGTTRQFDIEAASKPDFEPIPIDDSDLSPHEVKHGKLEPVCRLHEVSTSEFDSETTCRMNIEQTPPATELEEGQAPGCFKTHGDVETAFNYRRDDEKFFPPTPPSITRANKFCTWLTPYRQMFILFFLLNFIGMVLELSKNWTWATHHLTPLVVGNMLLAIAIRSEWVLRFLYWICVKSFRPTIFPLWSRIKIVGILYHIGGVHSSSGVSALLWLLVASYHVFGNVHLYNVGMLITLSICLVCLFVTCITAFPVVRARFHNSFELLHRFLGWLGILSTTSYVILDSFWDVNGQRWDTSASRAITKSELWLLLAIFIIILFSWVTTRRVPVIVNASSEKASVIRVPGGLTSGLHTRISFGGLREWHIFGSISEGKNAKYHYIVAAVQGDFTRRLNTEQPRMLYTKLWKPCGLPYFSRLFKRGVAICTGSGIGAVASTCLQHDNWFLLWIGPDLNKTYGSEIVNLICDRIPPERRLIWDTRGPLGRPDVVQLLQEMHQYWQAEVTLFIGSPALNQTVLRSSRALKIPVFGSIWDA